ncbi:MAG: regulatory protein RecX [Bacteroidota bacterium]
METPADFSVILAKMKTYCNKAERCTQQVKLKLQRLSVPFHEQNEIIAALISENFMNEARFASAYANDHFQFRKWSKLKIKMHLRQLQISDRNIQDALSDLPHDADEALIKSLIPALQRKYQSKGAAQWKYVANALVRKGFSTDLVFRLVKEE